MSDDRNGKQPPPRQPVDEERLRSTDDASVWAEEFAKIAPGVDRGTMIGWFANCAESGRMAAERRRQRQLAELPPTEDVRPAEVLFGFLGWLTCRSTPVTFSASHEASPAVELLELYCEAQGWSTECGPDYPHRLKTPPPGFVAGREHDPIAVQDGEQGTMSATWRDGVR